MARLQLLYGQRMYGDVLGFERHGTECFVSVLSRCQRRCEDDSAQWDQLWEVRLAGVPEQSGGIDDREGHEKPDPPVCGNVTDRYISRLYWLWTIVFLQLLTVASELREIEGLLTHQLHT